MGRFSKADIEFHYDRHESHAAVNVKIYDWREPDLCTVARDCGATEGEAADFAVWYRALSDEKRQGWADLAMEIGWETLQDEAQNAGFPSSAKVYSEGRSCGWAVIDPGVDRYALGDRFSGPYAAEEVAAWDALAVARWGRFSRYCANTVADLPYQAASLAYINAFEPDREARETARRYSFFYDVPGETVSGGAA